jgi:phage-related protein
MKQKYTAQRMFAHEDLPLFSQKEERYLVNVGSKDTMELIASRGKKGLNPKTHKWQVIDKDARYEIANVQEFISDEGEPYTTAELYADRNLKEIAKAKSLIYT